jgi:hypothetical protein
MLSYFWITVEKGRRVSVRYKVVTIMLHTLVISVGSIANNIPRLGLGNERYHHVPASDSERPCLSYL